MQHIDSLIIIENNKKKSLLPKQKKKRNPVISFKIFIKKKSKNALHLFCENVKEK